MELVEVRISCLKDKNGTYRQDTLYIYDIYLHTDCQKPSATSRGNKSNYIHNIIFKFSPTIQYNEILFLKLI